MNDRSIERVLRSNALRSNNPTKAMRLVERYLRARAKHRKLGGIVVVKDD